MTCREMSLYTKEPCGKPLPCDDHSTPTNAPESAGGEEQRRFLADACLWLKNLVTTNDEDAEMRNRLQTFVHAAHISTPAAPQPETCVTCSHTLTGVPFCTAAGCLCPEHRGPTLTGAEEWRSVALELATEVKRLNERPAPQPETETDAPKFHNVGNGHCLYCDDVGNLHRRVDQPDGHMVCYDCSRAYRLGWTAAKGGRS